MPVILGGKDGLGSNDLTLALALQQCPTFGAFSTAYGGVINVITITSYGTNTARLPVVKEFLSQASETISISAVGSVQ